MVSIKVGGIRNLSKPEGIKTNISQDFHLNYFESVKGGKNKWIL